MNASPPIQFPNEHGRQNPAGSAWPAVAALGLTELSCVYLISHSVVDSLSDKKKQIPEQPSLVPIRVLSASLDSGLNSARAMLLRDHGFDVTTSENVDHAVREIKLRELDVLIFGSTLPRDNCWTLAEVFRLHHSKGKIIEILPSPWAAPKNRPDIVVMSSDEPEGLLAAIRNARV